MGTHDVDALLVLSFGGPEGPDEVMPFLRRVVAGRGIPDERLRQVATQYDHFGGKSPLNDENRALVARLAAQAPSDWRGEKVYLGNRNSQPFLADTLQQMAAAGVGSAAVFITSAFSSYSGCRQYRENLATAVGDSGIESMSWRVLPRFHDHPLFEQIWRERIAAQDPHADGTRVIFVTHSLPTAAGQRYRTQHEQLAGRIMAGITAESGQTPPWVMAFQSRSGPPTQPWLEPDIGDVVQQLADEGVTRLLAAPIGFCADNLEIRWDLDVTAGAIAVERDVEFVRLAPPQDDPRFVDMILDLLDTGRESFCARDCCPNPRGPRAAIGDAP